MVDPFDDQNRDAIQDVLREYRIEFVVISDAGFE